MAQIASLLGKLPTISEARMVTNGFGIWIAWKADLNQAVGQTLTDYGGKLLVQERDQALWFFFSSDVILALARLEVWVRFNPVPVFVQVFPAKLILGYKLEVSMGVDSTLANQETFVPNDFEVLVHQKVVDVAKSLPGVSFEKTKPAQGMASQPWCIFSADPRLPYQSSLGWYIVFKPLGSPLDKVFQNGWREFFPLLEEVIKRMKLKYLLHDFFLLLPMENLRQLRTWCREFLLFIQALKESNPDLYWPCVLAAVEKKGLNFNVELPKKVPLDWDQLMPDFPHVSYRTAFLLGEHFQVNDVRFSVDQSSIEDWCNVSLSGDSALDVGTLAVVLPHRLVSGTRGHCFYCGLRSHELTECPTRELNDLNLGIWNKVAQLSLEDINEGFSGIDKGLQDGADVRGFLAGKSRENTLMQGMLEISSPVQLRMAQTVWRSTGKDYPKGLKMLGPHEKGAVMEALAQIREGEYSQADRTLSHATLKSPRSFQLRTLQGYSALEKGDMEKATAFWKEADALSTTPLQHAYHVFLQARVMEILGKLQNANSLYKQVVTITPRWLDALYRQGVCMVKMGFAEQGMSFFEDLFSKNTHMFNRVLIDAELERGHLHLLSSLYVPWVKAEEDATQESHSLEELHGEIGQWFVDGHPLSTELRHRIEKLQGYGQIKNYVAFDRIVQGRAALSKELMQIVDAEGAKLKAKFNALMERLRVIQGEASWFPFPRILVDFNKDFNYCARSLNWAFTQHFQIAETFRKATKVCEMVEEKLEKLESQLKTLKIVRDSTLFMLIMGKTFFWLELVGLIAALFIVPLAVWFGKDQGYFWATALAEADKWEMRRVLVIILSVTALGISALRAALVFEGRKNKLFKRGGQSS